MSGHSKWSTIKRQKGVADIKRGQTFTKIANAIALAARQGGSDSPETNPRLRMILETAKKVNMPKDNVTCAIDRGLGRLPGQVLEEVMYEGFGPGKVAFLAEVVTDNKMRTNQFVKNIFDRAGGSLGGPGSVAYMFGRIGEIRVKGKGKDKEGEILELIDMGASDIEDFEQDNQQCYLVYVQVSELSKLSNLITQSGYTVEESDIVYKPSLTVEIKEKDLAEKIIDFTEKLEDFDDIQKVYANFDIPDEILEMRS